MRGRRNAGRPRRRRRTGCGRRDGESTRGILDGERTEFARIVGTRLAAAMPAGMSVRAIGIPECAGKQGFPRDSEAQPALPGLRSLDFPVGIRTKAYRGRSVSHHHPMTISACGRTGGEQSTGGVCPAVIASPDRSPARNCGRWKSGRVATMPNRKAEYWFQAADYLPPIFAIPPIWEDRTRLGFPLASSGRSPSRVCPRWRLPASGDGVRQPPGAVSPDLPDCGEAWKGRRPRQSGLRLNRRVTS